MKPADALFGIAWLMDKHCEQVPAVRIGATDLFSPCGLPRPMFIHSPHPVVEVPGGIVNIVMRSACTNPINELKPLRTRAERSLHRLATGVTADAFTCAAVFEASIHTADAKPIDAVQGSA